MYINKAIIFGNLTRDPEIKALPSGSKVCSFSIATNRVWKDKSGAKQEGTDYHNIVSFGRQAEIIAQYLRKGSSVYIEGRMQTRSWDDKSSGEKKYRTEIVADSIQFGPKSSGGGGAAPKGGAKADEPVEAPASIEYPEEEINPDDIPF
jgi:single-strand DNA-binding protein